MLNPYPGRRRALAAVLASALAAAAACTDDPDDYLGDPGAYDASVDLSEQALLCPQEARGAFNNSNSPFRWGDDEVRVQVDLAVDFRCPACLSFALLAEDVWRNREDFRQYVRLYFHHFPLESRHLGTAEIHVAAAAAAEQDPSHFWALHDRIFLLAAEGEQMSREQVDEFLAGERELDMEAFAEAMRSDRLRDFVQWDKRQAVAAGATGTPSLFICGEKNPLWTELEQQLDRALNGD